MHTVISAHGLSKVYRKRTGKIWRRLVRPSWEESRAVDNISFEVNTGEAVAFLGPNGAGKTTTTKMLTGLVYPSGGELRVLGYVPFDRKREFLCGIGLVMGNKAGLNWDLTARQSFGLIRQMYELSQQEFEQRLGRYASLLKVGHKLDIQVRRLSLGERMKLELIGAILHAPKILFLDEPTIGLDIESKHALRGFLQTLHREQGVTMLLTSHDMDDVEAVCERVIVINDGKLLYNDTMPNLLSGYYDERFIRVQLHEPADTAKLEVLGKVLEVNPKRTRYLLEVPKKNLAKTLSRLGTQVELADITIETTPLEQIIGDLYRTGQTGR